MTLDTAPPTVRPVASRRRHHRAACVLLVTMGAACGGGGEATTLANAHARSAPRSRPRPPAATRVASTAGATTSSTSAPAPPPVSDAPAVVDRGSDHVAIARSLLEYGRWLEQHPDRGDVERAYAPGSPLAAAMAGELTRLRHRGRYLVERDREPFGFEELSALPEVVSFRVTEQLASRELVTTGGQVVRRDPPGTERYVVSIMRFAPGAPWRLNLVELQGPPIEVQL